MSCILATTAILLSGCRTTPPAVSDAIRVAIQERTQTVFRHAVLLKPQASDTNKLPLAPLILQEVVPGAPRLEMPQTVFTWTQQGLLDGRLVKQIIYVWGYPNGNPPDQGVRITLNDDGMPIFWEVLRDKSGLRVIYVGQSLEAKAMQGFAMPLPSHRYWIEPASNQSPRTVIARVLDETNVPMGPIVYLEADNADVSTIICRCMDAQALELVETRTYELVDLDKTFPEGLQPVKVRKAFSGRHDSLDLQDLSGMLRLPVEPKPKGHSR